MNSEASLELYGAFCDLYPGEPYPGEDDALGRIINQAKASQGLERLLALNTKQTDHLEAKCATLEQAVHRLSKQIGYISMAAELYHRTPKAAQWQRLMTEINKE